METPFAASSSRPTEPASLGRPIASDLRFDWVMVILGSWMLIGGGLDAWAHLHGQAETFFTPWHAVLYTGFLALAGFLGGTLLLQRMRGYSWQDALPSAYRLSVIGVGGFAVAGAGDLLWHQFMGVETGVAAALSPTHLALSTCLILILSGPFRAAWQRPQEQGQARWSALLPTVISLTLIWSSLTLITEFAHPFVWLQAVDQRAMTFDGQALGVLSICLQTIIMMGLVLLMLRRWQLPFGALTLMFALNSLQLSTLQDHYFVILVAIGTGLLADMLLKGLKPSMERSAAMRLFAGAVPVILYGLYFLALQLTTGIQWTADLWLGSVFVAGICGLLLSYILVLPLPGRQLSN